MIVPISVVIPTYNRSEELLNTLTYINECSPKPSEIIVHVDGNDSKTINALSSKFPEVFMIISPKNVGPGGGRNKGIEAAENEMIACFDDDSFPIDTDYFARLLEVFTKFPEAVLIESAIYHKNESISNAQFNFSRSFLFTGCGVAYRRSEFLKIGGYVPVPIAYGIEEADFSLRAFAQNKLFIKTQWLRVFHNTILQHHASKKINEAAVANIGLLVFLRYPLSLWIFGLLQVFNRINWSVKYRRFNGLLSGFFIIPKLCYRYRDYRHIILKDVILKFLSKRNISEQL